MALIGAAVSAARRIDEREGLPYNAALSRAGARNRSVSLDEPAKNERVPESQPVERTTN